MQRTISAGSNQLPTSLWRPLLAAAILALATGSGQAASLIWTNTTASGDYTDANNWAPVGVPGVGSTDATIFTNDTSYTVQFPASAILASNFFNGHAGVVTLDISGASWTLTNNANGTASDARAAFVVAQALNTTATVYLAGGTLAVTNSAGTSTPNLIIGGQGVGEFRITNGTVISTQTKLGTRDGGRGTLVIAGSGAYYTNSSTFNVGTFSTSTGNALIISNSALFISGGSLTIGNGSGGNSMLVDSAAEVFAGRHASANTIIGFGSSNNTVVVQGGAGWDNGAKAMRIGNGAANNNLLIVNNASLTNSTQWDIGLSGGSHNSVIFSNNAYVIGALLNVGSATGSAGNLYQVGGLGLSSFASNGALNVGAVGGGENRLIVTNATLIAGGAVNILIGSGSSNNTLQVLAGGTLQQLGANIRIGGGNHGSGTGNVLLVDAGTVIAGGTIVGTGKLGSPNTNAIGNQLIIRNGGQYFGGAVQVGNVAGDSNNSVFVTAGGVLEIAANSAMTILAGSTGNTISNVGGVYQFERDGNTFAPDVFGNIAITDGTISYRAINDADIRENARSSMTNIAFAGNNTFMLNAASNVTSATQSYRFDSLANTGIVTNYQALVLVNGDTAYRGGNITVGSGGAMLISNTQATITGLFTNSGSLSVANARVTYESRVYNNGTSTMLNSFGTFSAGVINAGRWETDPTTNIFQNFGLTNTISGVITMAAGDRYVFTNTVSGTPANFINVSTNKAASNLLPGSFLFSGGLSLTQQFTIAGRDLGPTPGTPVLTATNMLTTAGTPPGFTANFALGTLEISNFSTVRVTDAFMGLSGLGADDGFLAGLYVENLFLGANSLLIIDTNVQVYFRNSNNWTLANIRMVNNQGLGGDLYTYDNSISGLHQLVIVPEPSTLLLLIGGLGTLWLARGHRRRKPTSR
ncbi:MAG: hypothetical protein PCFJNLEI_01337 [Verrucomicrobiae bacterium]|nr:hypothetical protein [Verrucomicrobiae bacterium]